MTIDLDNDQQIAQDDNIESLVLDEFTSDLKDQIIEDLAEGIMSRILEDERTRALSSSENIKPKRRWREDRRPNHIEEVVQKILKNTNTHIDPRQYRG